MLLANSTMILIHNQHTRLFQRPPASTRSTLLKVLLNNKYKNWGTCLNGWSGLLTVKAVNSLVELKFTF